MLDTIDLNQSLTRKEYVRDLLTYQLQLRELALQLYQRKRTLVIVYQGWDAAGKGGNIRRLTRRLDPRGYEVIPVAAPNDVEKSHHYLWRFWRAFPKAGHITIFDRSWYGRVLVERVEGLCKPEEWHRAYREIKEMEQHWSDFGAVVVKLWLQIDRDEQLRRFRSRRQTAHKRWKITEEDWRNRRRWRSYQAAVEEMLLRTATRYAPWTIVESNCKLHARIKAQETAIKAISKRLKKA